MFEDHNIDFMVSNYPVVALGHGHINDSTILSHPYYGDWHKINDACGGKTGKYIVADIQRDENNCIVNILYESLNEN
jgi:hypothetical protein